MAAIFGLGDRSFSLLRAKFMRCSIRIVCFSSTSGLTLSRGSKCSLMLRYTGVNVSSAVYALWLAQAEDLDVICIVESWLNAEILDAEISLCGYQCYRRDRNRHGGGVVVYIRDCIATTTIGDNTELERLILSLSMNIRKATIGTTSITLLTCHQNSWIRYMTASKIWTLRVSQTSSFLVTSIYDLCNVTHPLSVGCLT